MTHDKDCKVGTIGTRLREWRVRRGLRQRELARVAGITQATVSNYEAGKREPPLATTLVLMDVLGIGLADLLPLEDATQLRGLRLSSVLATLLAEPTVVEAVIRHDLHARISLASGIPGADAGDHGGGGAVGA